MFKGYIKPVLYFAHQNNGLRACASSPQEASIYRNNTSCHRYRRKATDFRYKLLRKIFKLNHVTGQRQQFISRIVAEKPFGDLFSPCKLYKLLTKVSNNLLMNELEIAMWAILIDQLTDAEKTFKPRMALYFTAFAAKSYFCEDMCIYELRCRRLLKAFNTVYSNWLCMTNCSFDISLRQINEKFNDLSQPLHSPSDSAQMLNDLTDQMIPRYRKPEAIDDTRSEASTVADMETQLEIFEQDTLGGEKLEPIGLYTD